MFALSAILFICSISFVKEVCALPPPQTPALGSSSFSIRIDPSHIILPSGSHNFTNSEFELILKYTPSARTHPLSPYDVSLCAAAAVNAATVAGANTRLPRAGFRTTQGGVWMQAYPRNEEYTWGLMAVTVEMVEKELHERGYFNCEWDMKVVEGEWEESFIGWGTMRVVR